MWCVHFLDCSKSCVAINSKLILGIIRCQAGSTKKAHGDTSPKLIMLRKKKQTINNFAPKFYLIQKKINTQKL